MRRGVVGFGGAAGSGKTTAANMLVEIAKPSSYAHIEFSDPILEIGGLLISRGVANQDALIEGLRHGLQSMGQGLHLREVAAPALPDEYAAALFGGGLGILSAETKSQHRPLLEWIGRTAIELVHPEIWGNIVENKVLTLNRSGCDLITVGGVRTLADSEVIRGLGGVLVKIVHQGNCSAADNPTEYQLDDWYPDFLIDNSGTIGELRLQIVDLYDKLH